MLGKSLEAYNNALTKGKENGARRESNKIKFNGFGFERSQVVGFRKETGR